MADVQSLPYPLATVARQFKSRYMKFRIYAINPDEVKLVFDPTSHMDNVAKFIVYVEKDGVRVFTDAGYGKKLIEFLPYSRYKGELDVGNIQSRVIQLRIKTLNDLGVPVETYTETVRDIQEPPEPARNEDQSEEAIPQEDTEEDTEFKRRFREEMQRLNERGGDTTTLNDEQPVRAYNASSRRDMTTAEKEWQKHFK